MEHAPTPEDPSTTPIRRPYSVPKVKELGSSGTERIANALDALAPPYIHQEADATRALARELEVQEHSTEQQRYGVPLSEWRMGKEVIHVGPAQSEETRLKMQFADAHRRHTGAPEIAPPTIDDIRFGTGRFGKTIIGEVIASQTLSIPEKQPRFGGRFRRLDARHAAPRKEWGWRRRAAAGMAAALALTSAVLFTGGSSHNEATPEPQPTYSAPEYTAKPDTSTPILPAEKVLHFSFEDGNNSYLYTTDESGEVTQISGTLGEGENPWTLTEGAYKILVEDVDTQDIVQSDPFMQTPQSQQQARQLPAGIQIVWQPVYRDDRQILKA